MRKTMKNLSKDSIMWLRCEHRTSWIWNRSATHSTTTFDITWLVKCVTKVWLVNFSFHFTCHAESGLCTFCDCVGSTVITTDSWSDHDLAQLTGAHNKILWFPVHDGNFWVLAEALVLPYRTHSSILELSSWLAW